MRTERDDDVLHQGDVSKRNGYARWESRKNPGADGRIQLRSSSGWSLTMCLHENWPGRGKECGWEVQKTAAERT
jgi:hypothetical protein